ncbi:MAG: hypothetical protein MZU95_01975 [Desulfomicrobium escambiense]|nr:hypothetical protein [Desulfomicrobium escambiense]
MVIVRAYGLHPDALGPEGRRRDGRDRRPQRQLHPQEPGRAATTCQYTTAVACTSASSRTSSRRRTASRTSTSPSGCIDYGFHPPTIYFPLIVHGRPDDRADRDREQGATSTCSSRP